jgi:hypothetical protein
MYVNTPEILTDSESERQLIYPIYLHRFPVFLSFRRHISTYVPDVPSQSESLKQRAPRLVVIWSPDRRTFGIDGYSALTTFERIKDGPISIADSQICPHIRLPCTSNLSFNRTVLVCLLGRYQALYVLHIVS